MFLYDDSNLPFLIIHFKESDWDVKQFQKFINTIETLLQTAKDQKTRITIFVEGKGGVTTPPIKIWWNIIKSIRRLRELISESVNKTAVYSPTNSMQPFFTLLFSVYKPARPLKIFYEMDKALGWIKAKN